MIIYIYIYNIINILIDSIALDLLSNWSLAAETSPDLLRYSGSHPKLLSVPRYALNTDA